MASIQALVCCLHLVVVAAGVQGQTESDDWPCDHTVFCNPGEEGILHTVQMSGLFNDSKTFVDMPMNYDTETVQRNFDKLPDKNDVSKLSFKFCSCQLLSTSDITGNPTEVSFWELFSWRNRAGESNPHWLDRVSGVHWKYKWWKSQRFGIKYEQYMEEFNKVQLKIIHDSNS